MKRLDRRLFVLMSLAMSGLLGGVTTAAELDDYVSRDDPSFSWKAGETIQTKEGTIVDLPIVSQTWHGIVWKHRMRVYESSAAPSDPNTFLLFITGGGTNSRPNAEEDQRGLLLAKLSGARVAILPQVPNQPLLGDKVEDTLIAETFVRYLETRDATWPLLFPMVKSAVRAMDAVQAWSKESGKPVPSKFVVTGASKRGWTTWLTGAYDPRVVAIAPMVIDTLNFRAQRKHYLEVWGKPSEEIDDYTKRGLNDVMDKNEGEPLWKMVDPYIYLNRLTKPKLIINGTNDPYWTVDALNIYWNELKGPKSVVYLPNAGHGLEQHRDYALGGIGALVRHTIAGKPFPTLSWTHSDTEDGGLRLTIESSVPAVVARAWVARSDTRDFRQSRWEETKVVGDKPPYKVEVARPEKGRIALLGDLEFEIEGVHYHLSTQVRETGAKGDSAR